MQWLTVAWWRWRLTQARGRNALVRTSDRIEVTVMALAVAISLAALPVALAIGTAVHEERAHTYAAQQHDRHRVTSTTDRPRWQAADVENPGVLWASTSKNASGIANWVDANGRKVSPPAPSWQAGADALVAAAGIWLSAVGVAALLVAAVRASLRRSRYAGWNREIATLVHDDGGRTNRRA